MKKILLCLLISLFCVACQSSSFDEQFQEYYQIKEQLISHQEFDTDYPFHVQVVFYDLEDSYRYDVIIDQPQVDMYYIEAMAYAHEDDQKMCPVLGIVDDSISHMKVDYIDKSQHFYKGVQLSGETEKIQDVKIYVCYYLDKEKTQKVEKYIEVQS